MDRMVSYTGECHEGQTTDGGIWKEGHLDGGLEGQELSLEAFQPERDVVAGGDKLGAFQEQFGGHCGWSLVT